MTCPNDQVTLVEVPPLDPTCSIMESDVESSAPPMPTSTPYPAAGQAATPEAAEHTRSLRGSRPPPSGSDARSSAGAGSSAGARASGEQSDSSQASWSYPKPPRRPRRPHAGLAEARLGQVLGSYRLIEVLGLGGMGTVYRAEHTKLGREVALKLLHEDYAQRRDAVARFFQEARAVNKIRHRNIVDISDLVELDDGTTFLVMELLSGVPLTRVMRGAGELEPSRALPILLQICDGLSAAHSVGIVHRDLKPDNIFVTTNPDGTDSVKLLDFGVAKLTGGGDQGEMGAKTVAGAVIGTPAFMSPEQAGGLRVDARSDVYSLGAIMYEMFTQTPMFRGKSFGDYVRKHLSETPTRPSRTSGGANIDPQLEALILKCLSKSPTERYQSAQELQTDLLALQSRYVRVEQSAEEIALSASGDFEPATEPVPALRSRSAEQSAASGQMLASNTPSGHHLPAASTGSGPAAFPSQVPPGVAEPTPSGSHSWSQIPAAYTPAAFPSRSSPGRLGLDTSLTAGDLPRDPTQQRPPWRLPLFFGGALVLAAGAAVALLVASDDRGDDIKASGESAQELAPKTAESGASGRGDLDGPSPIVKPMVESGGEEPKRGSVTVRFVSQPSADIYASGSTEPSCTTPCDVTIDPEDGGSPRRRDFTLRRRGYEDKSVTVNLRSPRDEIEVGLKRRAGSKRQSWGSARKRDSKRAVEKATASKASGAEPKERAGQTDDEATGKKSTAAEGKATGKATDKASKGEAPEDKARDKARDKAKSKAKRGKGKKAKDEKAYDPQDTLDPFGS